jgi:hypothetical protein
MVEEFAIDWKKDSQSFDTVASLFDQYRPGYSQELVDDLVVLIKLPIGSRILEVGSGTGKATYSDHLRLSAITHQRLFDGVAEFIASYGGNIKRDYVTVEFIAQKFP